MRYYVIEVTGDNDPLHERQLAETIIEMRQNTRAFVSRAWVQGNNPTPDPVLVDLAVDRIVDLMEEIEDKRRAEEAHLAAQEELMRALR